MSKNIKVLSIDGGGIRGIISAVILAELERLTETPISKLFDLIAGTSAGGILTLALTAPNENGKPKFSAAELVTRMEEDGPYVFSRSFLYHLYSLGALTAPKYPSDQITRMLHRDFGNARLKDVLTSVIVSGYELERRNAFFFKSRHAKTREDRNFFLRDVARATSAAPTYFAPAKIPANKLEEYFAFVDGGVFANNPGMCAYVEAHAMWPDMKDVTLVSVGTGIFTRPLPYDTVKSWGLASWAQPILDIVFDGVSDTVDYQLRELLPYKNTIKQYYRFQTKLDQGDDSIDNTSPANLRTLKLLAEETIAENQDELKNLAGQLLMRE